MNGKPWWRSVAIMGNPGMCKIAARFGVDPGTVQRISRPFGSLVLRFENRFSLQGLNSAGIKSRIATAGTKYLAMSLSPPVV